MKKQIVSASILLAVSVTTMQAGGLSTNTNQNASFLRQMSQDGIIDITGLYANPAGTAFLLPGFHLSLNVQNARQSRDITTDFPLFAYNRENPQTPHRFHGKAVALVIPSIQASYNWERWSVNGAFALGGGGGKCEFDEGLGTFEALYAGQIYQNVVSQLAGSIAPTLVGQGMPQEQASATAQQMAQQSFGGYDLNAYMKGRNYQFHLTLGSTYKILDNLSAFVGLRGIFATNNYNGWVSDIDAYYTHPVTRQPVQQPLLENSLDLNTDQTGFAVTPVIGMDWQVDDHWNLAFKYEAPTKLKLKNASRMNAYTTAVAQTNPVLGQFADGRKVREDIPAILGAGAKYSPVDKLRLMAGWHWYFDKQAKKEGDKQDLIDKGTMEFSAGAEFDVCKWLTLSGSWQNTSYRVSDAFMNDLSFNLSNNSMGIGARVRLTERCHVDLGYMQSFYHRRDVFTTTALGVKQDHYLRRNRVFGLGVNIEF
ncbi:MAG: hypothetical protein K6F20_00540 [Bacteroidaceae bacterium]|nr:hypothetical protein [Bacteroidaceae bacterium]